MRDPRTRSKSCPGAPQDQSARSLTQSAASLKTGQFRLKRWRGGKLRGAGTPRLREIAITIFVIKPWREEVSGKWREQCHNLLDYLFNPYGIALYAMSCNNIIRGIHYRNML